MAGLYDEEYMKRPLSQLMEPVVDAVSSVGGAARDLLNGVMTPGPAPNVSDPMTTATPEYQASPASPSMGFGDISATRPGEGVFSATPTPDSPAVTFAPPPGPRDYQADAVKYGYEGPGTGRPATSFAPVPAAPSTTARRTMGGNAAASPAEGPNSAPPQDMRGDEYESRVGGGYPSNEMRLTPGDVGYMLKKAEGGVQGTDELPRPQSGGYGVFQDMWDRVKGMRDAHLKHAIGAIAELAKGMMSANTNLEGDWIKSITGQRSEQVKGSYGEREQAMRNLGGIATAKVGGTFDLRREGMQQGGARERTIIGARSQEETARIGAASRENVQESRNEGALEKAVVTNPLQQPQSKTMTIKDKAKMLSDKQLKDQGLTDAQIKKIRQGM